MVGDFPFMLSLVEAFIGFFSRIITYYVTAGAAKIQRSNSIYIGAPKRMFS